MPVPVDDPEDPRLAVFRDLTDADLRRRVDEGERVFIAEGELVIRRLVGSPFPVRSVLVTPSRYARLRDVLDRLAGVPVYVAEQSVMNRTAGFNIHRGAVAAAGRLPPSDPGALLRSARRVAVLERITDTENMGALFRNAAAFGVDAVLLSPGCCDPLYRRTVRVSLGHALRLPFAVLEPWPDALADLLAAGGFEVLALTPDEDAQRLRDIDPAVAKAAVLVGTEGPGLSDEAMRAAGRRVRIPMADGVDSLNVAVAAAVAFHHLAVDVR